jgi:hypothetical protein
MPIPIYVGLFLLILWLLALLVLWEWRHLRQSRRIQRIPAELRSLSLPQSNSTFKPGRP